MSAPELRLKVDTAEMSARVKRNRRVLHGEHTVELEEMYPPEFMSQWAKRFRTIAELVVNSPVDMSGDRSPEMLDASDGKRWEDYIAEETRFSSWRQMVDQAALEWTFAQLQAENPHQPNGSSPSSAGPSAQVKTAPPKPKDEDSSAPARMTGPISPLDLLRRFTKRNNLPVDPTKWSADDHKRFHGEYRKHKFKERHPEWYPVPVALEIDPSAEKVNDHKNQLWVKDRRFKDQPQAVVWYWGRDTPPQRPVLRPTKPVADPGDDIVTLFMRQVRVAWVDVKQFPRDCFLMFDYPMESYLAASDGAMGGAGEVAHAFTLGFAYDEERKIAWKIAGMEDSGARVISEIAAELAREVLILAATLGAGNAARAGSRLAKLTLPVFSAYEAQGTIQYGLQTLKDVLEGNLFSSLINAGFTALSLIGFKASLDDLAKVGKKRQPSTPGSSEVPTSGSSPPLAREPNTPDADLAAPASPEGAPNDRNAADRPRRERGSRAEEANNREVVRPKKVADRVYPSGKKGGIPTGRRSHARRDASSKLKRDLQMEDESADILSRAGYRVDQNPPKRPNSRKRPDFIIEGKYFDNYAPTTPEGKSIVDEINDKVLEGQADRIVLNLKNSSITRHELRQAIHDYATLRLKEIILIDRAGNIVRFYP